MRFRKLYCIFFILVFTKPAFAQCDSLHFRIESKGAISTQGYLPLWIVSNRYGLLEDETDALLRTGFEVPYTKGKKFDVSYGLDIVGKKNLGNSRLQQGFLKVKYGIFEIRGGRIEETTGLPGRTLSSGSMAQSMNAMPVPKMAINVPEYAPVPYTKGYLKFKGYFGHGWLGEDRYVENSFLHEKRLYIKAGGNLPVNLYGGFVHYAVWGGNHPAKGGLPSSFRDYLLVFQGKSADESSSVGGEIGNALGNHLGIYDFGVATNIEKYKVTVYSQTPWETLNSLKLFRNMDRLLGITIHNSNEKKVVTEVLYEYLFTKDQRGPGLPDPIPSQPTNYGYPYGGRNDYHNNWFYRSGWTYKNRIIGTPLFTTNERAENFFNELNDYGVNIVNNRIVAHHVGLGGFFYDNVAYRLKATYTRNYGTYAGLNLGRYNWASMDPDLDVEYVFDPPLNQIYFMLEINTILPFSKNITLQTAVGYDTGDIYRNFGALFGLQWNGFLSLGLKK